jgi:dipeptidyl aminopeptidase/acylaminoacyl peptidase
MNEQRIEILSDGLTLQAVLQTPSTDSWPLVVCCHGFLSHKDSSKYEQLAQVFAAEGIASLRFDFRGCGESGGLLRESTVSGRWNDLQRVIEQVETLAGFNGRFGLLGSSLGGYLALLEVSRNPRIRCVVVWSTPSDLLEFGERLEEVAPVAMARAFHEDIPLVELLSRLKKIQRVLIVHGLEDQQVPREHASILFDAVEEPKDLHLLENGDHRFTSPEVRERAIRLSLDWFRRFL